MSLIVPLGSQAVTSSTAALGSAVPTGQIWRITAVNVTQPTGSDAKTVVLALGIATTAANVKKSYPLVAGVANATDYPNIVMVAGDQVNVIEIGGTTAQANISVTVAKDLIA